jgi:hypothetical protein
MARFNLEEYATVEERLSKFWQEHPEGAVHTELVKHEGDVCIFKAYVWFERGEELVATGFAEEIRDASPVNKTSFVENAETSAIGRALANANYAMKKRPSREEMVKAQRGQQAPAKPAPSVPQQEDGKLSEDQVSQFFIACATKKVDPKAVAERAGNIDLDNITVADLARLRVAFKELQASAK